MSISNVALSSCVSFVASQVAPAPTATVKNGSYSSTQSDGLGINQYLGIKFGNAPRFARPTSLNSTWLGAVNATEHGANCPQSNMFEVENMGEDCLNLNVWQPNSAVPGAELPVLVWIFGGGKQPSTTT